MPQSDATALLQRLVRAQSPNPPGNEVAVQRVVGDYLSGAAGIDMQQINADTERPIIVATAESGIDGPTILFCGHIDTVPVGDGWTRDPFGAEIENGVMYGRGASDMKGGVAAMLVALRRLAAQGALPRGRVAVHVVPDEEPGGELGAAVLLEQGYVAGDAAIVTEPSELAVFRAQKGNIFAAIRVRGRAAHGSMPERGVNAISAAARLIIDLEERLGPSIRGHTHPLLGSSSLNVGTIHGGRRTNMVADECVFTVDRRLMPAESFDAAWAELVEFVGDRGTVELEQFGASFDTPGEHRLVQTAREAVTDVLERPAEIGGLNGSSDARFYADGAGIPTIILGPGSMQQAHVADEFVDVRQVETAVGIYEALVKKLLAEL
jgi:succinyl-diaminopimelate desuccinylase